MTYAFLSGRRSGALTKRPPFGGGWRQPKLWYGIKITSSLAVETMPQASPPRALEIEEDMAFQRRNWLAERIGWAIMALVLVAAALGAFAVGPLSWTTARDAAGTLVVEYERMQRQSAPATVKVRIAPQAVTAEGVTIEVDEAFADAFKITEIRPQPAQSMAVANGMRFRFDAAPNEPATIYFHLSPENVGFATPHLGLGGRDRVALPTFIYP
jgi:hypothetical protein